MGCCTGKSMSVHSSGLFLISITPGFLSFDEILPCLNCNSFALLFLQYKIDKALVKTQKLNLSVWHNDTFGRNSFLGEVELDLKTWDWNDKLNKQMNWYPLKPRVSS